MSFTHNKGVDMPLTPLRAFVAVGQHGNFTRAAAALGVTQGAVSRHIATLETFAGGRLFGIFNTVDQVIRMEHLAVAVGHGLSLIHILKVD